MGSPLGPTFAVFYVTTIENKVVPRHKHTIYTRYVDDILVVMDTPEDVEKLTHLAHTPAYITPTHTHIHTLLHTTHTYTPTPTTHFSPTPLIPLSLRS